MTHLEQPDVAFHAIQVVLGAPGERVEDRRTQVRLVLRQRILQPTSRRLILRERHRTRLVQAAAHQVVTHAQFGQVQRMIVHGAGPERAQFILHGVEAAAPEHFLDQVHLEQHVLAPRRRCHDQRIVRAGSHGAAERLQQARNLRRGYQIAQQLGDA